MQQRRQRPGDVLDDYCPRERRITDHAIVAMIDDNIKQTRCVVCDAEHEYKQGKIPPQRRKKVQSALFTQVLDGLQPSRPPHQPDEPEDPDLIEADGDGEPMETPLAAAGPAAVSRLPDPPAPPPATLNAPAPPSRPAAAAAALAPPTQNLPNDVDGPLEPGDEGSVRRPLIRATLPRPEGTPPPARSMPEFTIRQPTNARGRGPGGRRRNGGGFQSQAPPGVMRFGRGAHAPRPPGPRGHGNPNGNGHASGHGNPGGNRSGGPRRGGKKR